MLQMIDHGHSAASAIATIKRVYGDETATGNSMSMILSRLKRDERIGGHPQLNLPAVPVGRRQHPSNLCPIDIQLMFDFIQCSTGRAC